MTYSITNLFNTLFAPGEKINIRVIKDDKENRKGTTRNACHIIPTVSLCNEYPDSFPCVGINPRVSVRKLASIKNMVIDIDSAALPEWAKERADIICTRDANHHHLYFCFAETTRENYKRYASAIIKMIGGGDAQVSDPERVIRLPYFTHRKESVESKGYKIAFIRKTIERLPIEKKFEWVNVPAENEKKKSAPAIPQDYNSVIAFLKATYMKKPPLAAGDGRSRELLFIGFDCHRWGLTQESALALAQEISNERHDPPESNAVIEHQIDSAYKYAKCEFGAALIAGSESEAAQRKIKHQFDITQRVREKLAGWVYIHGACRLSDSRTDRALTSKEQIEDYISREIGEPVNFRRLLSDYAVETCDKIEYAPQRAEKIFEINGETYFNSFRPNTTEMKRDPKLKKTAAKIFNDHINFIATSDVERDALRNYFAFCVQNVGQKVDWTPLIISKSEGLGKSAFSVLFRKIFGEHNCSTVSAQRLLSGWTDFIAEKLFVTSHEVETSDTAAITELKTLITEERVRVNAKYARTYETDNRANFLLLSNKLSALRLENGNARRFLVIYNDAAPKEKEYYTALFNVINNGAGWVYDYLMSVDLSAFDAHGHAPATAGLAMIAEVTKPDTFKWLESQYEQCAGAFATPFVDMIAIERDAAQFAPPNVARYINSRTISTFLYHVGYKPREYRINGVKKHSWFNGDDIAFEKEKNILRDKLQAKEKDKKSTAI